MMTTVDAKIMLVDDEEQFLAILAERLRDRGLDVTTVTSGEEALVQVAGTTFDAIVIDLAMPGIDGIETLKRIKEIKPDVEIIMLTGHGSVKSGIEAMKLGAEEFLEKPIDIEVLLEKIRESQHHRLVFRGKS